MNSKNTWLWLAAAVALFAFIFLFEHYRPQPVTGPQYLLPGLNEKTIKTVQIRPAGQLEMRVERTNGNWQLAEPVVYPAQNASVQALLQALENLTVDQRISEKEMPRPTRISESIRRNFR
jgi:hypothetical protein